MLPALSSTLRTTIRFASVLRAMAHARASMPSGSSERSVVRALGGQNALDRQTRCLFFRAGQSREDADRVGLPHRAQGLQLARDLLPHRRDCLIAQRCQTSVGGFERDDRSLHVAVEREAALRELEQKHRFGARPGAFRTFGAAAQLFEREQQAPRPASARLPATSTRRSSSRADERWRFVWLLSSARSCARSASAARAMSLVRSRRSRVESMRSSA